MGKFSWLVINKNIHDNRSNGFTLIELLAVIVIIGILSGIALISVSGIIDWVEKKVCETNVSQLEKDYKRHLALMNRTSNEVEFMEFLLNYDASICPVDGEIRFVDGVVECSIHSHDGDGNNEEDDGEVPYL